MKKSLLFISSFSLITLFTACGGGGGSSTIDCTEDPTAEGCAGPELTVCLSGNSFDCDGDGLTTYCDSNDNDATVVTPTTPTTVATGNEACDSDSDGYIDALDLDGDGELDMVTCQYYDDDSSYTLEVPGELDMRISCDICPLIANPNQTDADNDLAGDECGDVVCTDADHDAICDDGTNGQTDNCPSISNYDQTNQDSDAYGDICDDDIDGDGILDDGSASGSSTDAYCTGGTTTSCDDNCMYVSNAAQTDTDGDGVGDDCEDDSDGDGILNETDECDTVGMEGAATVTGTVTGDSALWTGCCWDTDSDAICDVDEQSGCVNIPNADDVDCDGTPDDSDTDDDNDGLGDTVDLCPNHSDSWYVADTIDVYVFKDYGEYYCGSGKYFVIPLLNVSEFNEEYFTAWGYCSDTYPNRESEVVDSYQVRMAATGFGLLAPITWYDYQKDVSFSDITISKASNYESSLSTTCTESESSSWVSDWMFGDYKEYKYCGVFQANRDGDSYGDACDPDPDVVNRKIKNSYESVPGMEGGFWESVLDK